MSYMTAHVPGDGMNAYMAYKVTTKVRKHERRIDRF